VVTGGLLGGHAQLAQDPLRLERLFAANFTGTALLCQQAAARLAERGGGVVCAFSSVAGERARKANYLYGASKAGLSAFLDGLGLAYADHDVRVVCVKPGFVRTEMTAGLPAPPFAGEPDAVAARALRAMDAGQPVVYAPAIWRWIMLVLRALPRPVMRRLPF
jgi:decaprenylphospho-beta-D-erythro-pentofuranosid-2-ulose 2-reductase